MILDDIKNAHKYMNIHPGFESAFKFMQSQDLAGLAQGKYEIDGSNVFAIVQQYVTKSEAENKWEAHKKYIDIQYIVKGSEMIGWAPLGQLVLSRDYLEERDIAFFDDIPCWAALQVKEGLFAVFFPEDAHKPCNIAGKPEEIKKIVIKIRV